MGFIRQADAGVRVADLCRKQGFSLATFYKWRAKFGGMQASDAKRLRELEADNARLKKLLADLAAAVDKAIADGETLQGFRKRFAEIVDRHGWHGWTGQATAKGRAWRTRVIYETNLITSYAAGRYAQLQAGGYDFWIYKHSDFVQHPRPLHVAWNGLTLPANHPFWQTHYPPNGWGCRCRAVGARGPASIRRLGGDPDKPLPAWVGRIDPKTGAPVGIDKGFAYAPGASVAGLVRSLAPKLDRLPRQPSIALIQSWLLSDVFERWFAAPKGSFPLMRLPDADAEALGAVRGVRVAHLSAETARKQAEAHPELTPAEYAAAQTVVDNATAKAQDGKNMIYVREMDAADTGGYVLVVKATQTGEGLWVTSYRRLSRKEAARDSEVRRLLRKDGR